MISSELITRVCRGEKRRDKSVNVDFDLEGNLTIKINLYGKISAKTISKEKLRTSFSKAMKKFRYS